MSNGVYFCESCIERFDQPGVCPKCNADVLLDLREPDVVEMLQKGDSSRRATQVGVGTGCGVIVGLFVVGIPLTLAIVAATGRLFYFLPCVAAAMIQPIGVAIALTLFPPVKKCPADLP